MLTAKDIHSRLVEVHPDLDWKTVNEEVITSVLSFAAQRTAPMKINGIYGMTIRKRELGNPPLFGWTNMKEGIDIDNEYRTEFIPKPLKVARDMEELKEFDRQLREGRYSNRKGNK